MVFNLQYTDKSIGHQFFTSAKNSKEAKQIFVKYFGSKIEILKTEQLKQ